jgi:hypothetical protein
VIGYVITVILLYFVCSLLKSPAKLLRVVKPKRKSVKKKSTKYQPKTYGEAKEYLANFELEKFSLNKINIKEMLKEGFISSILGYSNEFYFQFPLLLENYFLWKFNKCTLSDITKKKKEIIENKILMEKTKNILITLAKI